MKTTTSPAPVMPVSLLLEDKSCLVVGGGRVAARKVGHLLHAGARVTVVSPELCADLAARAQTGAIRHRCRRFSPADVGEHFLVLTATDDGAVNQRVIRACRRHGILCSATDAHWRDGDFITPAIARHDDITVAVSTGGRSCRRASAIKTRCTQCLAGIRPENNPMKSASN